MQQKNAGEPTQKITFKNYFTVPIGFLHHADVYIDGELAGEIIYEDSESVADHYRWNGDYDNEIEDKDGNSIEDLFLDECDFKISV